MKKNCGTCEHWQDLQSYSEDALEPNDYGFCHNKKSNVESGMCPIEHVCNYWKRNIWKS